MKRRILPLALLLLLILPRTAQAAIGSRTTARQDTIVLENIEFDEVPAAIALRTLARTYDLNLSVAPELDVPITLHIRRTSPSELFAHIRESYPIEIKLQNGIWHAQPREQGTSSPQLKVAWQDGLLELRARSAPLDSLAGRLVDIGLMTLLPGTQGTARVSGFVSTSNPVEGVRALLRSHDLRTVQTSPGVLLVEAVTDASRGQRFELYAEGRLVTFRLREAPLRTVLERLAEVLEWNAFFYGEVSGTVTASAARIPANEALDYLLVGTGLGARVQGNSLLIGNAEQSEFGEVRLIRLRNLSADGFIERLPERLASLVQLQPVPEQNGIAVTGAVSAINAIESYVTAIDHPTPQILFETLVVDYLDSESAEFGVQLGVGPPRDSTYAQGFYPGIDVETRGSYLKGGLELAPGTFNLPVVGQLPDDFYVRLKAMESAGRVRIRSRPQLATVNGNTATLTVGATQYFLIRSETTFAQQTVQTRISERFETIEANMSLQITPWVTSSGQIITRIRPEFNTPQGSLNAQVPPTINHRIIDTTVQLRDGETIVLGGLIQETTNDNVRRFPILWRIPLLGKLFVNKVEETSTSELMIYLTPHIHDGPNYSPPEIKKDGGGGL